MRKWLRSIGGIRSYEGREFPVDTWVELESEFQPQFMVNSDVRADIEAEAIEISANGLDAVSSIAAALALLDATTAYRSSYAVDKNDDTPQDVTTTDATVITAHRALWDFLGEFNLGSSKFFPSIDGIWNMNGTVTLTDFVNVSGLKLHIYRNDEIWFTVVDTSIPILPKRSFTFSCDVDAYASESHDFDLRIELVPIDALLPISATISGADEETAWGMTFLHALTQASPT